MNDAERQDAPCAFCTRIATSDVEWLREDVCGFEPLNPVVPGHYLVLPVAHVPDITTSVAITAEVMKAAAHRARRMRKSANPAIGVNLITSAGVEATQSIFHLHVHLVPRCIGDGLHLPWTGQQK